MVLSSIRPIEKITENDAEILLRYVRECTEFETTAYALHKKSNVFKTLDRVTTANRFTHLESLFCIEKTRTEKHGQVDWSFYRITPIGVFVALEFFMNSNVKFDFKLFSPYYPFYTKYLEKFDEYGNMLTVFASNKVEILQIPGGQYSNSIIKIQMILEKDDSHDIGIYYKSVPPFMFEGKDKFYKNLKKEFFDQMKVLNENIDFAFLYSFYSMFDTYHKHSPHLEFPYNTNYNEIVKKQQNEIKKKVRLIEKDPHVMLFLNNKIKELKFQIKLTPELENLYARSSKK